MTNRIIAGILALSTLAVLMLTAPHIGVTWDEPAYITASESYVKWFGELVSQPLKALNPKVINHYWRLNAEHPPLDKIWSGLAWSVSRQMLSDLMAHRLGNMILVAFLTALLFLLVAETYGRVAGLLSVGILLTLPRFFFHAHLAALDVPAAVMIFTVIYIFWKTKDKPGIRGTLALGTACGLAMATKVNAVFIMPTLFIWALLFQRDKRMFGRLLFASIMAFPVFLSTWPWLYPAPLERIKEYLLFLTTYHWEIGQWYLHEFHMPPPWHFPFVMVIAVVPLTFLLFYWVGIARIAKEKKHRSLGVFFLLNSLVPLLALAIGKTMVYDNDRLFMPAFVFIAAISGIGIDWFVKGVRDRLQLSDHRFLVKPVLFAVYALIFTPHLVLAVPLFPHWLSYYSESVGGLTGAQRIGLETTYWCETYNEVLQYLNVNARHGDTVWVDPYSNDVMIYYQQQGSLRPDIQVTMPGDGTSTLVAPNKLSNKPYTEADFIVLHHRQTSYAKGGKAYPIVEWLKGRKPDFRFSYKSIPLIEVYQMRH